jgi:hypothetical protein
MYDENIDASGRETETPPSVSTDIFSSDCLLTIDSLQ